MEGEKKKGELGEKRILFLDFSRGGEGTAKERGGEVYYTTRGN